MESLSFANGFIESPFFIGLVLAGMAGLGVLLRMAFYKPTNKPYKYNPHE